MGGLDLTGRGKVAHCGLVNSSLLTLYINHIFVFIVLDRKIIEDKV